jgi:phosphatidylinositol 4-kinase
VLIDDVGHIIHIDYGFTLGISPGGNLGFETAAFKLTAEMVSLLGGLRSELFGSFVDMAVRGFLVTREAMDPILDIVYALEDSGLPNFMHKPDNLEKLKARFVPEMTTTEAAKFMHDKVFDAADKWTTNAYDNVQKVQNNIY